AEFRARGVPKWRMATRRQNVRTDGTAHGRGARQTSLSVSGPCAIGVVLSRAGAAAISPTPFDASDFQNTLSVHLDGGFFTRKEKSSPSGKVLGREARNSTLGEYRICLSRRHLVRSILGQSPR